MNGSVGVGLIVSWIRIKMPQKTGATKNVFVTVGTTSFDNLIKKIDTEIVREALFKLGFCKLLFQIGNGAYEPMISSESNLQVDYYRLKEDINKDIYSADLVISHAGAGTVLETLGAQKPLLVVINEELMGNHQTELAKRLSEDGHLIYCTCGTLEATLHNLDTSFLKPFPEGNREKFANFLNKIMDFE